MRQLKFQAWLGNNTMVQVADIDLAKNEKGELIGISTGYFLDGENKGLRTGFRTSEVTFREYTGLKDKNGQDIYDGDVVKLSKLSVDERIIGDIGWFGWYGPQAYFGLWVKYRSYSGEIIDEPLRICATGSEKMLDKIEVIGTFLNILIC